jgi:hypothetical protein
MALFTSPDRSGITLGVFVLLTFLIAYGLHRATLSWAQISPDSKEITFVPSSFARRILDEKPVMASIPPGSEILLSRQLTDSGVNCYMVIVRTPNRTDQVVWNEMTGVSRRWWNHIANEITGRYQIPVRLITQHLSGRDIEETEWTAESNKGRWKNLWIKIGPTLSPLLGIPTRMFTSNPWIIVLAGTFFWLADIAVLRYIYRTRTISKEQSFSLMVFVWTLQFVTFYAVVVIVTGKVLI